MVISDTKEFIFIHAPKCAGTSVRKFLSIYDTRNNFYWGIKLIQSDEDRTAMAIDKAHMPLGVFRHLYPEDFTLMSEYTTFAITRHPKTRLISAFRQYLFTCQSKGNFKIPKTEAGVYECFNEYIATLLSCANLVDALYVHAAHQAEYHIYRKKNLIDVAIRLEDPAEGIAKLKCLNFSAGELVEAALNHSQKNRRVLKIGEEVMSFKRLWGELQMDLKERYQNFCKADCALFGYDFTADME